MQRGQPLPTLAFARALDGDHYSPCAMAATHALAETESELLDELTGAFRDTFNHKHRLKELRAQADAAAEAAVRVSRNKKE